MPIKLSTAIEGFMLSCEAARLSPHTIRDYSVTLRRFAAFVGEDRALASISRDDVRRFLRSLAQPQTVTAGVTVRHLERLSDKTILNYHTGLGALWTWAVGEELVETHLIHQVERPKPETRAVAPLSEKDIKALLTACDKTVRYDRPGKKTTDNTRPTKLRDRAIVFLMLDTGLRASELCGLAACDVDFKNARIWVMGKGKKERFLPMSPDTRAVLWKYLNKDRLDEPASAPLFAMIDGRPMTRVSLLQLLRRLGERAGVRDVHPHRFRHTFAIQFLRNGGDVYALQAALGHTTLEMVRRYLQLAQTDIDKAHETASPVAKWRLR